MNQPIGRAPGRPRKVRRVPAWFRVGDYAACADLDAGDWYINLWARRWLLNPQGADAAAHAQALEAVLERQPVFRRADSGPFWHLLHIADAPLYRVIHDKPQPAVWRVDADEARRLVDGENLTELLAPLLRVNLARGDAELTDAFAAWIAVERRRLQGRAAGSPGLRAGAALLHAADTAGWARIGLLAVADLMRRAPEMAAVERAEAVRIGDREERSARDTLGRMFADGFTLERTLL